MSRLGYAPRGLQKNWEEFDCHLAGLEVEWDTMLGFAMALACTKFCGTSISWPIINDEVLCRSMRLCGERDSSEIQGVDWI